MSRLKFVDWFAGIGGFRIALEHLGMKCVGACENDKWCRQIYGKKFGHEPEFRDATAVDPGSVPDHDLFCGGFPCQSFSTAGKWKGFRDIRGTLFFDACRVIEAKRPRFLLLENVKSILRVGYIDEGGSLAPDTEGWVFCKILESLEELGYDVQWQVLNSRDFGPPQSRERVYIVGHRRGEARPEVFPLRTPSTEVAIGLKGRVIRPLGNLRGRQKTGRQSGRVWGVGGLAPTITSSRETIYFETPPGSERPAGWLRRLTPVECERLQGFPDNWTEGVSDTQRYKQIGNAVTVDVVEAVGAKMLEAIRSIRMAS